MIRILPSWGAHVALLALAGLVPASELRASLIAQSPELVVSVSSGNDQLEQTLPREREETDQLRLTHADGAMGAEIASMAAGAGMSNGLAVANVELLLDPPVVLGWLENVDLNGWRTPVFLFRPPEAPPKK